MSQKKIWESIIERRLRDKTATGEQRFGFIPGRTNDAISAFVLTSWRNTEKHKKTRI